MQALRGSLKAVGFAPETDRQLKTAAGIGFGLSAGTTRISSMLSAMPHDVAAKVMTEFFNDLYRPGS